jgi:hypothetical protein
MKLERIKTILVVIIAIIVANTNLNAQVFTGFSAFKELIEYEGQRYLMEDIYQITTSEFDKLKIDKTIKEVDLDEGFMFVLTSYTFNGKSGVVITSFNSTNFQNTKHQFTNVHLTNEEYIELYNTFISLKKNKPKCDVHFLKKFKDRLIVDVNNQAGIIYFTLWVDNHSRHTFTTTKWDRAFKRYKKFIEN